MPVIFWESSNLNNFLRDLLPKKLTELVLTTNFYKLKDKRVKLLMKQQKNLRRKTSLFILNVFTIQLPRVQELPRSQLLRELSTRVLHSVSEQLKIALEQPLSQNLITHHWT
jgi:hypothetical protein